MTPLRWSIAVAFIVVAGLGLWLVLSPPSSRRAPSPPEAVVGAARELPAPRVVPTAAPARLPPTSPPAPVEPTALNVAGPGPNDRYEPGMVPHPLDDARARIIAENGLLQALNDAMSFRKVKEMRKMLDTYRKLDPKDIDKNQLGYEIIADCIEFPGEASITAAREFYATQRHSPLRRFVRRICFENTN